MQAAFDREAARKRREALGLTQGELADLVGVSLNALSRWETGKRIPGPFSRARLDAALDKAARFGAGVLAAGYLDLITPAEREAIGRLVFMARHCVGAHVQINGVPAVDDADTLARFEVTS